MSNVLIERLNNIKLEKDTKLIPDNIKKNITVFGITGTYEGSGGGGGSGDVKLFDTIANMQADPDPHEGDKAIVYRSEIQPVEENSIFSSCTFPSTVTLDTAITGYAYGSFRSADESDYGFYASVMVSPSGFSFQGYAEEEIRIEYSSSDGITYIRTDGGSETIDFGLDIKFEAMMDPWNDVFGQFMRIGGNHFDGLFEYGTVKSDNIEMFNGIKITSGNFDYDNVSYLITSEVKDLLFSILNDFNLSNGYFLIEKVNNNIYNVYSSMWSSALWETPFLLIENNTTYISLQGNRAGESKVKKCTLDIQNKTYTSEELVSAGKVFNNTTSYVTQVNSNYYYTVVKVTNDSTDALADTIYTKYYSNSSVSYINKKPNYEDVYIYKTCATQLNATPEYVYEKEFLGKNGVEQGVVATNTTNNFEDVDAEVYAKIQDYYDTLEPIILTNSTVDNEFKYKYRKAKVLPTRSDGTQFLNVDALGSVSGLFYDFSNLRTIPNLNTGHMNDFSIMLNNCQSLTHIPNIDTSNATNISSMFGYCHNLKSIPNLNTSKVTDMYRMFVRCNNLTTIPNLDTSNVTNMSYMFSGCMNLINIPNLNTAKTTKFDYMFENCQNFDFNNMSNFNTSNASSVTYMFMNCINMTDAPMIDTSNVMNINSIYYNCKGLVNVPALNTAKANSFSYCFYNCYNLVNIPVWNTSNIVDMRDCFARCNNLSNQSLDNILSMCASATKITNSTRKKLSYINLTQDQANICKNLPNYSTFTSAGWSTGY